MTTWLSDTPEVLSHHPYLGYNTEKRRRKVS
jgi:hypothetical protein